MGALVLQNSPQLSTDYNKNSVSLCCVSCCTMRVSKTHDAHNKKRRTGERTRITSEVRNEETGDFKGVRRDKKFLRFPDEKNGSGTKRLPG